MDPENGSQENKSTYYRNIDTIVDKESNEASCSFTSTKFDPIKALNTSNLCGDDVVNYQDLYAVRNQAHSEELLVMSHEGVEGVVGPGGFPIAKLVKPKITQRLFTEDQGPVRGKNPRRLRNVLNRMEEIQGPLAALKKCRDTQTRIKVYTRNHSEVRGIMTGYVVAFDKHWNLVLRDVDEIFHKKIKCKTPVFDDVMNFTKVADLSLREENDPEFKDPTVNQTSLIWPNPFSKKTNRVSSSQQGASTDERKSSEVSTSQTSKDDDCEKRRETRTTLGRRVDRDVLRGSSSFTREAKTLKLGRHTTWDEVRESSREKGGNTEHKCESGKGKMKKISKKASEEVESGHEESIQGDYSDKSVRPIKSEEEKQKPAKYKKRKRTKIELRQRHVGQILVRGENVVCVNILEV